jgi:TIR domain
MMVCGVVACGRAARMADIFVSYTSSDREWAFWIGQELVDFGHSPRIHEWELSGGADIMAWMEAQRDTADHVLCVVSEKYLKAPYSSLERRAAQWAAVTDRPNFALPIYTGSPRTMHVRASRLSGNPLESLHVGRFLEARNPRPCRPRLLLGCPSLARLRYQTSPSACRRIFLAATTRS